MQRAGRAFYSGIHFRLSRERSLVFYLPMKKPLKVVCYVPSFNAGDTTRGIEVARALVQKANAEGRETDVTFLCPPVDGPQFEAAIVQAGFKIGYTAVPLSKERIEQFMNADRTGEEFVPDYEVARLYIEKYMEDMRNRKPDLIINGCIPPAGIATRILQIPTVTYLPFPAHDKWVQRHLLKDVPDELENRFTHALPKSVRRGLVSLASRLAGHKRFFTQPTLARAGRELGWNEKQPNLFSMLRADVELVTDLPDFYEGQDVGPRAQITGPLFSRPQEVEIDPRILEVFARENSKKVLVTMGSSGEKRYLLEAIEAVTRGGFHAVVVVQPTICSMAEVKRKIRIPETVYLTDSFIPAHQVNPLADAVVIHGGQGTVQTAAFSGTPFVGVAMQAEQQANLDNLALHGAGIRIPRGFWTADTVHAALGRVLSDSGSGEKFKARAAKLAQSFAQNDGHRGAGEAIWRFVEARGL